ncbi:unnamed protein product [Arctogadus glacialis]
MSPIVEKMEGLKSINNRSNGLRLGRLALYCHLEKVETMRCFWELKHVELEGGDQQREERGQVVAYTQGTLDAMNACVKCCVLS